MADVDWTLMTNSLTDAQVRRGVTTGVTPPNGGGSFTYGMRSIQAVTGGVGLYCNVTNFDPMAAGGRVSGALRKGSGTGTINYCPMLVMCLQGTSVTNEAYLLGFTADEDPSHLILVKAAPSDGVSTESTYILRQSTNTYQANQWYHFQLDAIVQPAGDTLLKVQENDLTSNTVTSPSWAAVPGMTDYTDDVLGATSGTPPYVDGRVGWAMHVNGESGRAAYVDHLVVGRQL